MILVNRRDGRKRGASTTTALSHFVATGISVSDLDRSADFYTRVLGMKVQQTFKLDDMDEVMVGYEGKAA